MLQNIPLGPNDLVFYFQQYADRYSFLFPLGVIGLWRWSVWLFKEIVGSSYKPQKKEYQATVSLVTPVYNENPNVFATALESWKKNNPTEIIAVIDYTDLNCIEVFKKFSENCKSAVLIVTNTPGKRPALADGIKKSLGQIVALVDSDTIWADDVIKNGLPPFHDERVAGVATYQSVYNPKTFAQKIFDVQLDLRYMHEYPFLAAAGDALVCLSGRTAFYRRLVITPMLHDLLHETFMGKPVISGDDKCLTYLVLAAGWKVAYQSDSHVYTPGMADLSSYFKQRLRWTRNSLRSDIKAILGGWPLKRPALFFFQVDKVLQSFVVILSPIFFGIALVYEQYIAAIIIFIWWFMSRAVKMYSHLIQKPYNITVLPGFVLFSFLTGVLKIYALFTLNTQGWITRWDKSRLPQMRFLSSVPAYLSTASVIVVLIYGVYFYKDQTYFNPHEKKNRLVASALVRPANPILAQNAVLGVSTEIQKDLLVKKYVAEKATSISEIAKRFNIDPQRLYMANSAKLPSYAIPNGTTLSIPGNDINLDPAVNYLPSGSDPNPYVITYYPTDNTIVVSGRGRRVTLSDIKNQIGGEQLMEIEPKVWLAKASIYLDVGVTLELNNEDVTWLKLESNKNTFASLWSLDGNILVNGVRITSWDSEKSNYDELLDDGRSFIMVKDAGRMDFINSELAFLGFPTKPEFRVSPYGVSWKLSREKLLKTLLTGEVINSKFHHNYFGAYTFGATGMTWRGNEFYDNVLYGLDPHDDSNGFLVEENYAHNNGKHGIIFSKRCMYNIVRNNVSVNNGLHGIMLHWDSNYNIIENNTVYGNVSGITLWRSGNNIVRNNRIVSNKHGIRANLSSNNNLFTQNDISRSARYGFYLYDDAKNNFIQNNNLTGNQVAVYIKSDNNIVSSNTMKNNGIGVYFLDTANGNQTAENSIAESSVYAIYTKIDSGLYNMLGANELEHNRKDIDGVDDISD